MSNPRNVLFVFGFLTFFHLWGGAGIGAGIAARRVPPVLWGLLVGVAPLYFGIERGIIWGTWAGCAWQVACLIASALAVGRGLPRLRAFLLRDALANLMIGMLMMVGSAMLGALLFSLGARALSLILGGAGFLFGAMWLGSGIQRLCSS